MELLQFLERNWLLASLAAASGILLIWPYVLDLFGGSQQIGTHAVTRLINQNNAVLLDVRETKEFEGGKLPHALHIPMSELKSRAQELAKFTKRPVIAYFAKGGPNGAVAAVLKQTGFNEVYQLQGGLQAWKDAGLPVERP